MNLKFLVFAFLIAANINANNEQLQIQISAKKEQLDNLYEQVIKQDQKVKSILKNFKVSFESFKEHKKKQLNKSLSDEEFYSIYMAEFERFAHAYYASNINTTEVLFDASFFGEDTELLKFYSISSYKEKKALQTLLRQWCELNDEITLLQNQLEPKE